MNRKIETVKPVDRLLRMRKMFAKGGGILIEDYEYFTMPDGPIHLSKADRRSAKLRLRPTLGPN